MPFSAVDLLAKEKKRRGAVCRLLTLSTSTARVDREVERAGAGAGIKWAPARGFLYKTRKSFCSVMLDHSFKRFVPRSDNLFFLYLDVLDCC